MEKVRSGTGTYWCSGLAASTNVCALSLAMAN